MPHTIAEYEPTDAPAVAALWNRSQSGWPAGFGAPPFTPEAVVANFIRPVRNLAIFLAHADGKVVGWCNLTRYWDDPRVAYVGLLNVDPQYYGQGIGRDLLRAAFDRSVQRGFKRLDLHTWAGNHRALRLYKRMGFFWVPETYVHMENYLPGLIREPIVQQFLGHMDWYAALKQPITLVEDDHQLDGRPVFAYQFERDGQRLRIVVDRASQQILAVDAPGLTAGLQARPRLVVGASSPVTCEVKRSGEPTGALPTIGAIWTEGAIAGDCLFSAADGLGATADVAAKHAGRGTVFARIDVRSGPLRLAAGVEVVNPIEVTARPRFWSLAVGEQREFSVDVKNNTGVPVTIAPRAIADRGLVLVAAPDAATVPASESRAFRLTLRATGPGRHWIDLVARSDGDARVPSVSKRVPVLVPEPGQVLVADHPDEVVLENTALRVRVQRIGGAIQIERRHDDQSLGSASLRVGPPYRPSEIGSTSWSLTVDASDGRAEVTASVDLPDFPGCSLVQNVRLTADSSVRLTGHIRNGAADPLSLEARWGIGFGWARDAERAFVMPIDGGIVREPGISFPDWYHDESMLRRFDEPWLAAELAGSVIGCAWSRADRLVWDDWRGLAVVRDLGRVAPGQMSDEHSTLLWAGAGNWRALRERWRDAGVKLADPRTEHPGTWVQLVPSVAILDDDEARVTAHVRGARLRRAAARLNIIPPAGYAVSPDAVDVAELGLHAPCDVELTVRDATDKRPIAGEGTIAISTPTGGSKITLPIIRVSQGDPKVTVEEQVDEGRPTLAIDNGWACLRVAPDFGMTLWSWEREGVNQLHSAYPNAGAFAWWGPWVGGIGPAIFNQQPGFGPGHAGSIVGLHPSWQPVATVRRRGRDWSGARLWFRPPFATSLLAEIEYLTLPGSNLLLAIVRLKNEGVADEALDVVLNGFFQPGGQDTGLRLHWAPDRPPIQTLPSQGDQVACGTWAAVEGSRQTVSLVSLCPDAYVQALMAGAQAISLFLWARPTLRPGEQYELTGLYALAPDPVAARVYRHLGGTELI